MSTRHPVFWRSLVGATVLSFVPAAAGAVEHEVRILLDLDDDAGTGCLVNTAEGPFEGVEQVLITTVETTASPDAGTVTDAATADCTDPATDSFSSPTSFDDGWPVGVGNGEGGRDVVETYFPLVASVVDDPRVIRLGVVVTDEQGGEEALLTVDGAPGGEPIVLDLRSVLEIPTLGEWGLILLVLLLAAASVALLGRRGTVAFVAVLVVLGSGVAWAAGVLDGLTDDWSPADLLGSNGLVLFGKGLAGQLCFRVDVDLLFNQPPVAEPDAFATDEDTVLSGENVLADNGSGADSDPTGDPLTVTAFDAESTQGAAVSVAGNGDLTYDPTGAPDLQALAVGESVDDTFTYTIEDPSGGSDTATVTVAVDGVNDPPTAEDDSGAAFTTDEATAFTTGSVLTNDTDPDASDVLSVDSFDATGTLGTVADNGDGTFDYDPDGQFDSLSDGDVATDTFTYTVTDGNGGTDTATVTITIDGLNDPPVAQPDAFTTDEDTVLSGENVLADNGSGADSDPNGDPVTVTGFESVSAEGAEVAVAGNGDLSFDPTGAAGLQALAVGESVDDTFTYTIEDPDGASDTATVTVTVDGVNDPPTANDDSGAAFTTDEDTAFTTGNVLTNDTDPDASDVLSVGSFDDAGTVGAVVDNGDGTFGYDPAGNFESLGDGDVATDTFTYTVTDGNGGTDTATVTITIQGVNDAPLAAGETFDGTAGNFDPAVGNTTLHFANGPASLTHPHVFEDGDVLDNDSDPEGDPVTISAVEGDAGAVGSPKTLLSGAVVTLSADGEFTYSPPTGFEGTDSFTYTVSDGTAGSTATVTIEIADVVWYLDGDASGGDNDGRSASPFESVADFNAVQGGGSDSEPEAGDVIFLHDTSTPYSGGIELLDQQKLHGEGVGLTVGAVTLVPAGNRPALENGAGDAVTVLADTDNGDRTGIEIRGLALASTGDDAVDVTSADAETVEVTITDNLIDEAGGAGIDVNPGSSGDFTVTVSDNTWSTASPAGDGLALTTAAGNSGDVFLALDNSTDVTGGGAGVRVDGSAGTGTVYVTSLSGNTVNGATAAGGMLFDTVVFDADPSDADFTGDTVDGGTTAIGASGDRVSGAGLVLDTVSGDLSFTDLDVANDGGTGLRVVSPALFDDGAGTGFRLTTGADSTVDTANGPAVDIDPATLAASFASVTSTNSGSVGISLSDAAGSFSATGGSLATAGGGSGPTFQVSGGSVSASYGGSVASTDGQSVQVQNMTGGTVTLSGLVDDEGAGISITGNDAATSVSFDGGLDLATETDTAFTATGDGSVTVASTPTNTISTTTGVGVLVNGVDLTGDFDSVTVSNGGAAGISLQSSAGTKTFGTVSITNAGGAGLLASNAGTVNVTDPSSTVITTGHPAVDADNTTFGATFASLSSDGSGPTGIDLASVGGSFTVTSVTIDDTTGAGVRLKGNSAAVALNGGTIGATTTTGGNAVDVDGGTGNATVAADITNTAARSVEVTNRPSGAGAVTVSGAISDTGTGINVANNSDGSTTFSNASKVLNTGTDPAVTLSSNPGHTIDFTNGGLDIDTTSGAGLTATGGGTVNVTGADNTVDTTTGTAVNVVNTDIGANGLLFESISAGTGSGTAGTGIILDTTGTSGGLTVTGDGSTAGSGGTIRNKTGDDGSTSGIGVFMNDTGDVSLSFMQLNDFSNFAIRGSNVTNFDLIESVVNGVNGNSNAADEGSISFDNLLGEANFTNSSISGGHEDNIVVTNTSGTLDRMNVTGGTIGLNATSTGNDGILVESQSTATLNLTVSEVSFEGARGDMVQCNALGTSTMDCVIQDNTFNNTHTNIVSGGGGITLSGGSAGSNINMTYDVSGTTPGSQTFRGAAGNAITVNFVAGAGTVSGTVENNSIGVSGVAGSGSSSGSGILAGASEDVAHTATINNNTIRSVDGFAGIEVIGNVDVTMNATITNNDVADLGGNVLSALYALFGGEGSETGTLCLDVQGNTLDASDPSFSGNAVSLDQISDAGHYNLPGYTGSPNGESATSCTAGTASADVSSYLSGRSNTMTNGPSPVFTGGSADATIVCGVTGNGTSCP